MINRLKIFLVCLGFCACASPQQTPQPSGDTLGGGDSMTGDLDPGVIDPTLHGPCALDAKVGGFRAVVRSGTSEISGEVGNGVLPISILELVQSEGDCRLLRKPNPFCDPPCQAGDTCGLNSQCVTAPRNQDVGTVTMLGLAKYISMKPKQPGNNYYDTALPHPVFEPGKNMVLRSTGGIYAPFTLYGIGVASLSMTPSDLVIRPGEALALSWTAGDGKARVFVRLNIDQHGNTPVTLFCDFPDTGSATVSATLTDALRTAGISGFPSAQATRRTVDSASITPGCVELVAEAPGAVTLSVQGHFPCDEPTDCPPNMNCDLKTNTCLPKT